MPKSNFLQTKMFKDILTGGVTAIIGAIAGAILTALSISVNLNDMCKNTTKCNIQIETRDGKKIQLSQEDIAINETPNEGSKFISIFSIFQKPKIESIKITLTPEQQIALAPPTEPPTTIRLLAKVRSESPPTPLKKGGEDDLCKRSIVPGLKRQKIAYADKAQEIPLVKEWLNNPYSGYQQLVNALTQLLDKRQGIGNAVPLTIIQAKYLNGNTKNPPLTYDQERLKQAYIAAWQEKNSGSPLTTFDEIAPLNP